MSLRHIAYKTWVETVVYAYHHRSRKYFQMVPALCPIVHTEAAAHHVHHVKAEPVQNMKDVLYVGPKVMKEQLSTICRRLISHQLPAFNATQALQQPTLQSFSSLPFLDEQRSNPVVCNQRQTDMPVASSFSFLSSPLRAHHPT